MSEMDEAPVGVEAAPVEGPAPEATMPVPQPQWQELNAGVMDKTDLLIVPGGYLVRSVWQIQGRYSMGGCAMVFVPGAAPEGFA